MNKEFDPKINLPYPKVVVNNKDLNLAYKLFESYAGIVSEYRAIGQYSFQSIFLNKYKDLSSILQSIAIVEMKHLKLIGELIEKLGLIPYFVTYKDNKPIPWNSDFIDFTTNYRDMLINNIKVETETINRYNNIITFTDNQSIIELLKRIIMDEERHLQIFNKLLTQYDSEQ